MCIRDRYHTPFIQAWKVKTAISEALKIGLNVVINTMVDQNISDKATAEFISTLKLSPKELDQCTINPLITVPVGRANSDVTDFPEYDAGSAGCQQAGQVITITPTGDVFPCCGPATGLSASKADLFVQANIANMDKSEIYDVLKNVPQDLFVGLLAKFGPNKIIQSLSSKNPDIKPLNRCAGECDMCLEFGRNRAVKDAASALVFRSDPRQKIAV